MSIIVEHKNTRKKYILLGTGLGMYKSSRPGVIGGNLFPNSEEGVVQSIAVCDETGEIHFIDKSSVRVILIDGHKVADSFGDIQSNIDDEDIEYCPACNGRLPLESLECPHCGLHFGG